MDRPFEPLDLFLIIGIIWAIVTVVKTVKEIWRG